MTKRATTTGYEDGSRLTAWVDDDAWRARLGRDRERAERNQTAAQRAITEALLARARVGGCEAFALTGSTARNRRTALSDLGYHVVGSRPRFEDLADEVDMYATDARRFWEKLRCGNDLVQWTLRFGCILVDDSQIFRDALQAIATENIWPNPAKKFERVSDHRRHAQRLIEMGDRDAAQDQVRAALSSAARALLLDAHCFPLSRSELPDQLVAIEQDGLADALRAAIYERPSLDDLRDAVRALDGAVGTRLACPVPCGAPRIGA